MNKNLVAGIILLITVFSLAAEEPPAREFRLAVHPFDVEEAKKQIDAMCSEGFLPVGVEVDEGNAINIMYVETDEIPFSSWLLHQVTDFDVMENQLSGLMAGGWLPMGLSRTGSGLYVLFVNAGRSITSWRITTSTVLASDIEETLETYMNEGFVPHGISLFENRVWILFVKTEKKDDRKAVLTSYENNEQQLRDGIGWAAARGRLPWGIMVQGLSVSILYLD